MAKKRKKSAVEVAIIVSLVWFAVDMAIVSDVSKAAVKSRGNRI